MTYDKPTARELLYRELRAQWPGAEWKFTYEGPFHATCTLPIGTTQEGADLIKADILRRLEKSGFTWLEPTMIILRRGTAQ